MAEAIGKEQKNRLAQRLSMATQNRDDHGQALSKTQHALECPKDSAQQLEELVHALENERVIVPIRVEEDPRVTGVHAGLRLALLHHFRILIRVRVLWDFPSSELHWSLWLKAQGVLSLTPGAQISWFLEVQPRLWLREIIGFLPGKIATSRICYLSRQAGNSRQ